MGKNKLFVLLLCFVILNIGIAGKLKAQVYEGSKKLSSQQEVDDFGANNYTEITGSLTISGNDITNLNPLSSLTKIGDRLTIQYNDILSNLNGLNNITTINYLYISRNDILANLDGLSGLTGTIGERINIQSNPELTNINGLSNVASTQHVYIYSNKKLTDVNGLSGLTGSIVTFKIQYNDVLQSIAGMTGLTRITADLIIKKNPLLTDISGLSNITADETVDSEMNLTIDDNDALTNLDSFSGFTGYVGDIYIGYNESLTNINGLSNITRSRGSVKIYNNNSLQNIDGLSGITKITGGDYNAGLEIRNNPLLTNFYGLRNIVSVWGNIYITGNDVLTDISALTNTGMNGYKLVISGNDVLTSLNGLQGMEPRVRSLSIENNPKLTDITALSNLTEIDADWNGSGGYLIVSGNAELKSLEGLHNITQIDDDLRIENNQALETLDGLRGVTAVDADLRIKDNSALGNFCGLNSLITPGEDGDGIGGSYTVSGNAYNPTLEQLEAGECDNPVPVELTTFSASIVNNKVQLSWETATEVNNYGFVIERSKTIRQSANSQSVNSQSANWEELGFVQGHGNSNSPKHYSYTDNEATFGKYYYRLKQVDIDGSYEYSEVIEVNLSAPVKYELSQNYPNPFNPTTSISFSIAQTGNVKLTVYNLIGEEVAELLNKTLEAGYHSVTFKASNLNSGIYVYRLESNGYSQVRKMMLLK